jgi:hypothetical protein
MSQYPTVNELLDNWSVLTAESVTFPDATEEVRQLLSQITLERYFDRELWPQFKFFALVRPDNDILPVRTVYNGVTQNIGINCLTSYSQHSASRSQESCQGTAYAPEQFHDAAPDQQIWIPAKR